ncbi:MAG: peptidoglycan-binding protein [Timaviella obliquedivisa GSE-PSE-MK23-08B]|jgi:peptidoglycan hydrolase-like protein with peptidoglycan-binding domain|nr:peptidoglycan-binding protein [Timaviella obliquedivisa GSE-PSE-MK23-08B]
MKIFQSSFSVLSLLLTTAVLAPVASAVSAPALTSPSASSPSTQLISQAGIMSLGGSGPLVSDLQEDLASLGYFSGINTGYFGSVTEDAVIRFQRDAGLTADGRVGPATQEAIQQRIGVGAPAVRPPESSGTLLRRGDSGDRVLGLQNLMRREGYFSGEATGYFGSVTEAAVLAVQRANGLVEDGIAGPAVFAVIGGI